MTVISQFDALLASTERTSVSELEQLFDGLAAVSERFMLGEWSGGVFNTGHPGEQQLHSLKWAGKSFRSRDDVDPIISLGTDGARSANTVMGAASLREVTYRDVVSATMIYDKHPIFDHFRQIDEQRVLGVMVQKGAQMPLYFYLVRCS